VNITAVEEEEVMGWNDHVEYYETECLDCGEIQAWPYWDEEGKARYVGAVGALVNQDATKSGKCPSCGSSNGQMVDEDEMLDDRE
jgi:Zn finger protein HypA/HybF involved in hydrogenase expression